MDRRDFIQHGALALGAAAITRASQAQADEARPARAAEGATATLESRRLPGRQRPVITPNGSTLPLREKDGVKVGHLVAEPVQHEFAPGLRAECWGFNGSTPGPTIECVEGDRLRIYVSNRLP